MDPTLTCKFAMHTSLGEFGPLNSYFLGKGVILYKVLFVPKSFHQHFKTQRTPIFKLKRLSCYPECLSHPDLILIEF